MSKLPQRLPDIFEDFQNGVFSVQIGKENSFGRIPIDQATEETVNKDTKSKGGITKYSFKPGAVNCFYLTAEYRNRYIRQ